MGDVATVVEWVGGVDRGVVEATLDKATNASELAKATEGTRWHLELRSSLLSAGEFNLTCGIVAHASELAEAKVGVALVSFELTDGLNLTSVLNATLGLDLLVSDLDLTVLLEITIDLGLTFHLSLEVVLELLSHFRLTADFNLTAEFGLLVEFDLGGASLELSIDLELTSSVAISWLGLVAWGS